VAKGAAAHVTYHSNERGKDVQVHHRRPGHGPRVWVHPRRERDHQGNARPELKVCKLSPLAVFSQLKSVVAYVMIECGNKKTIIKREYKASQSVSVY